MATASVYTVGARVTYNPGYGATWVGVVVAINHATGNVLVQWAQARTAQAQQG